MLWTLNTLRRYFNAMWTLNTNSQEIFQCDSYHTMLMAAKSEISFILIYYKSLISTFIYLVGLRTLYIFIFGWESDCLSCHFPFSRQTPRGVSESHQLTDWLIWISMFRPCCLSLYVRCPSEDSPEMDNRF